jgi:hypothetical protein
VLSRVRAARRTGRGNRRGNLGVDVEDALALAEGTEV